MPGLRRSGLRPQGNSPVRAARGPQAAAGVPRLRLAFYTAALGRPHHAAGPDAIPAANLCGSQQKLLATATRSGLYVKIHSSQKSCGEDAIMSKNTKITEDGRVLYGFSFLFIDGTTTTIYAETYCEAAKIARSEYYGR